MKRPSLLAQLRWRIVAAHLIVVVVGVVVILVASLFLIEAIVPAAVAADLAAPTGDGAVETTAALLAAFRRSVLAAVAIAAAGAILAALVTGLILARGILNPLYQLAESSGRVAAGRYSERVPVPDSDELALVANSFNQMAAALERVEEQRVTLIADIAHELRTPLTALGGYLEGLIDGLFAPDEETFEAMIQELRRLQRLIDDLNSLSRVEAGQISLAMADQPLLPLVDRAVAGLQGQAEKSGVALVLVEPASSPVVCADADRVVQILHNLLSNAIRYTPAGGQISISVKERQGQAEVAVQDTGLGIPAEALPYVFERFYRVDSSRSRRSGGSGIGLTISRYLAWAMGGELSAASPGPGQGSTFALLLPLSPASGPGAPPATRRNPA